MIALSERGMPEFDPRSPYHQLAKIHSAYGICLNSKTQSNLSTLTKNCTIVHPQRGKGNGYQTISHILQDVTTVKMVIDTATYFIDQNGQTVMPPASISFGRDKKGSDLIFKLRLDPETVDGRMVAEQLDTNGAFFSPEGETVRFGALGNLPPTWHIWTEQKNIIVDDPEAAKSLSRHFLNWAHIQGLPGMYTNNIQTVFDPTEIVQTLALIDNSANPHSEQSLLEPVIFSKN